MLTESQINEYKQNGFVIPDFVMPENILLKIEERHNKLLKTHPEFKNYCPAVLSYDEGFLDFCKNEIILNFVEQLIGPNFALWNSSFFAKPAINGHATPWHQDGQYWPIRPLATCTVWLAIDDATIENGCLRFIKGSHIDQKLKAHNINNDKNLTLNQELVKEEYDEKKAVNLILKRGQISLHDVYLVHGSEANNSPKARRAITMRFMPTSSLFDHKLARDNQLFSKLNVNKYSDRKVFHARGIDISGKNNLTY
ncbi:phytanoyl-CoA dioxygenase family protein [Alphaproteobacteria bacterium]|jgi:ectoine hydroxylase-related dioxygenase (phytanoyl-CoA dioxygenase family)|nr:phytanoyl-CoA dioxygenase family protein [Alphaproteobacteria bacterium]MDB9871742.1 phytanoyl-CoA dioxygenase family protein [Alphaproteobacteria bacterium]|tara:strand:+ start:1152 stop:1913 length:762 start_codon:yes stop_codon:yes gene_type:complete